jgi:hypothetical protein
MNSSIVIAPLPYPGLRVLFSVGRRLLWDVAHCRLDEVQEHTSAVLLLDGSTTMRPGFCTIGQVSAAGGSRRCYG